MIPGNGKLSKQGLDHLNHVMSILDLGTSNPRPETLKIAFAKAIVAPNTPLELADRSKGVSEYPYTVLVSSEAESLVYKHLIYNKLGRSLDAKELEKYITHFVEEGLEIMYKETQELSGVDNYLLYLIDAANG